MKLGACDYLLHGTDQEKLDQAKQLGLSGVEIFLAREQLRDPAQARLHDLVRARKSSPVTIPSLALGHLNNGGWSSEDQNVVDAATEDVRIAIEWARTLGAAVILVPFFFAGDAPDDAGFARLVAHFRLLCPDAQRAGVTLAYEGQFNAARIRRLASEIDHPAFGCYFDLANVVWLGMDTPTEIRALGELIVQVHMKETRVGPGDVRPGQGRVKYAESAQALREVGYDAWLVMETPGGPIEQVGEDVAFTRRIFPAIA